MALKAGRGTRLAMVMSVLLLGSVLAASQNPAPNSPSPPSLLILSPFEILEPSTSSNPNDKDGYPPQQSSSADVEEMTMQVKVVVTDSIATPSLTISDNNFDGVDDEFVDNDQPRDLALLDGVDDDALAPGTYHVYFDLNKTGYAPLNTTPGTDYIADGLSSASRGTVNNVDKFTATLTYD